MEKITRQPDACPICGLKILHPYNITEYSISRDHCMAVCDKCHDDYVSGVPKQFESNFIEACYELNVVPIKATNGLLQIDNDRIREARAKLMSATRKR